MKSTRPNFNHTKSCKSFISNHLIWSCAVTYNGSTRERRGWNWNRFSRLEKRICNIKDVSKRRGMKKITKQQSLLPFETPRLTDQARDTYDLWIRFWSVAPVEDLHNEYAANSSCNFDNGNRKTDSNSILCILYSWRREPTEKHTLNYLWLTSRLNLDLPSWGKFSLPWNWGFASIMAFSSITKHFLADIVSPYEDSDEWSLLT